MACGRWITCGFAFWPSSADHRLPWDTSPVFQEDFILALQPGRGASTLSLLQGWWQSETLGNPFLAQS